MMRWPELYGIPQPGLQLLLLARTVTEAQHPGTLLRCWHRL